MDGWMNEQWWTVVGLAVVVACATGWGEELLFRGFIQQVGRVTNYILVMMMMILISS